MQAIVVLVLLTASFGLADDNYSGYQTLQVNPTTSVHWEAVRLLQGMTGVDMWSYPRNGAPGLILVSPPQLAKVHKLLIQRHVPYNVSITDVAKSLKKSELLHSKSANSRRVLSENPLLHSFLRYQDMLKSITNLKKRNPGLIRSKRVGITYEGRNIYVVKMSTDFSANKPVVFMEAGMHAREWAGPAMAMFLISKAAENSTLLRDRDWHIIPVANPDGYEYTHTQNRFWRKNRVPLGDGCYGVDPNRNFNVDFGRVGVSSDHCSEIYAGPYAFSEAESRAVQLGVKHAANRVNTFISIHSYGPFIIYPYGFTVEKEPPTAPAMERCVEDAKAEMDRYHANNYTVGNTAKLLYESSGGSDDWAITAHNIPLAYTVELPGGGAHGFDILAEELGPALLLSYRGILRLINCGN